LTKDSRASESRPTEPVNHQAHPLSRMVAMAAAIESHAKRFSDVWDMTILLVGAVAPLVT